MSYTAVCCSDLSDRSLSELKAYTLEHKIDQSKVLQALNSTVSPKKELLNLIRESTKQYDNDELNDPTKLKNIGFGTLCNIALALAERGDWRDVEEVGNIMDLVGSDVTETKLHEAKLKMVKFIVEMRSASEEAQKKIVKRYMHWRNKHFGHCSNCGMNPTSANVPLCGTCGEQFTPWASWIGCSRITLLGLVAVVLALFAFQQGKCFSEQKIYGYARMTIRQPTNGCNALHADCKSNFTALDKLPYCAQYTGDNATDDPKECVLIDGYAFEGMRLDRVATMFVPTYKSVYHQKANCTPNKSNNYECARLYEQEKEKASYYFADIERFTIMFDHSFTTMQADGSASPFAGDDNGKLKFGKDKKVLDLLERIFPGGKKNNETIGQSAPKEDVSTRRLVGGPIDLEHIKAMNPYEKLLKKLAGGNVRSLTIPEHDEPRLPEFPGVVSTDYGDIFTIGDLLNLAQPLGSKRFDMIKEGSKETPRRDGGQLIVKIEYHSGPFTTPSYTFSCRWSPVREYKVEYVRPGSDASHRELHDDHGLLISVVVEGIHQDWDLNISFFVAFFTVFNTVWLYYDPLFNQMVRPRLWNRWNEKGYINIITKKCYGLTFGTVYK